MRLLLDVHMTPAVAEGLAAQGVDAVSLSAWREGDFSNAPDDEILTEATQEQRVLVTYDQRTIRKMVVQWADMGKIHAGVVIVDDLTIRSDDIGGLIRALHALVIEQGDADWTGRLDYPRRY
jgi:predicted nuclease of predicted toxin-antitoxin system